MNESGLPGSTFSPLAVQATVGYGHRVLPGLSWGFGLKIIHEKIDTEQYSAMGLDLGLQWQAPAGFKAGFVAQNLGTPLADSDLARQVKVGLARELPWLAQSGDAWNAAVDVDMPLADARYTAVHLGMEYWHQNLLALRLGYQIKNNDNLSGAAGLAAGLGVRYSIYGLDYSLVSFGDLGLTHQFALSVCLK